MLVLDTAGRNAPAKRVGDLSVLKKTIAEVRSKARLTDDVILDYIVCHGRGIERGSEDYAIILEQIVKNKGDQELVLVHNLKRLHCNDY